MRLKYLSFVFKGMFYTIHRRNRILVIQVVAIIFSYCQKINYSGLLLENFYHQLNSFESGPIFKRLLIQTLFCTNKYGNTFGKKKSAPTRIFFPKTVVEILVFVHTRDNILS